jgi:hypothetical protein
MGIVESGAGMQFEFSTALMFMKMGERVRRSGWNGKDMWVTVQRPDAHSKMTLPYIYMSTVTGDLVPWLSSQMDLLANDWELINE